MIWFYRCILHCWILDIHSIFAYSNNNSFCSFHISNLTENNIIYGVEPFGNTSYWLYGFLQCLFVEYSLCMTNQEFQTIICLPLYKIKSDSTFKRNFYLVKCIFVIVFEENCYVSYVKVASLTTPSNAKPFCTFLQFFYYVLTSILGNNDTDIFYIVKI